MGGNLDVGDREAWQNAVRMPLLRRGLFYTDTYDVSKEARRADGTLGQGDWQRGLKTADWPAVIALAVEALTTRSQDLQVAGGLVEELVKQHRFAGLRGRVPRELLLSGLHHRLQSDHPCRKRSNIRTHFGWRLFPQVRW